MTTQRPFTEAFDAERYSRQGDALSTVLFNIVLEKVIRNIETNPHGRIFNRMRQYTLYAVDVLVVEEVVTRLKEAALSSGLVINESKTK